MSTKVTIGGERLGNGKKMKAELHEYPYSTHDLGYIWRSTMATGTLVPFMAEIALPGDRWEIDLNAFALTHPTIGPLFGSSKVQLDVFQVPLRLYQGLLHMNATNIGRHMDRVKLPQIMLSGKNPDLKLNLDNQQINPSCIFSYLNIRGVGTKNGAEPGTQVTRPFHASSFLAYWDIYKQYYANKQEEEGVVIHNNLLQIKTEDISNMSFQTKGTTYSIPLYSGTNNTMDIPLYIDSTLTIEFETLEGLKAFSPDNVILIGQHGDTAEKSEVPLSAILEQWQADPNNLTITGSQFTREYIPKHDPNRLFYFRVLGYQVDNINIGVNDIEPRLHRFPLDNIDEMRKLILKHTELDMPFVLNQHDLEPYNLVTKMKEIGQTETDDPINEYSLASNQEGLAIKTYQSDLFNNWISTEWIDGDNGVNEITKINTEEGLVIDELLFKMKIYRLLTRIAISGGTYDNWLDVTYTHDRRKADESPIYMGGLIKELTFDEIISNSENAQGDQPLGTLAGKGVMTSKHKGGKVNIRIDEHSYIIGIVSITPRLDYSQGNKWDNNLMSMDDFHKPELDEIGFQDLITDQMAWWDTAFDFYGGIPTFRSAGKQPAWTNYMTNVNQVRGNFAVESEQSYMVFTRRYEPTTIEVIDPDTQQTYQSITIQDVTTYIDPVKYNYIFANTRRDAQNYWMQISIDAKVRRKMSAKIMPNL